MQIDRATLGAALALSAAAVSGQARAQTFPSAYGPADLRAWILSDTTLKPQDVISAGRSEIIALDWVKRSETGELNKWRVRVKAEVTSPAEAQSGRYLSWSARIGIDCATKSIKILDLQRHSERGLRGERTEAPVIDRWVRPAAGAPLYGVLASTCQANFSRPLEQPLAPRPATAQPKIDQPASAQPSIVQPSIVPPDAGETGSTTPPPTPSAVPKPAPKAVVPTTAPSRTAPQDVSGATRSGSTASGIIVQVGAVKTEALARAEIAKVQSRFNWPQPLTPRIETVEVGGHRLYRARLSGFGQVSEARAFCERLRAGGQGCLVWAGPRPAP